MKYRSLFLTIAIACAMSAFGADNAGSERSGIDRSGIDRSGNEMPEMLADLIGGKYKARTLPSYTNLPDGERYAQLEDGVIKAYSYKTGELQDTLFDVNNTKLLKLDDVEGFVLSPTGRHLLVYRNRKSVYRRSFTADWYIYNIERRELKPLSDRMPVISPVFSPNGRYIAFSRDNNLHIHKLDFGTEVAVTTDGSVGKVINGTPDWLYEEEFSTTCMFAFSPDSRLLAFVRLDESEVPEFRWQEYLAGDYPEELSLKYPKSGKPNAKAKVVVYDTQYKSLKTVDLGDADDVYIPRLQWLPADDKLAVFRLNRNQNKLEMFVAGGRSMVSELVYTEENKAGYVDYEQLDEWQLLDDGNMIVVNETDGYRQVYLYSQTGQKLRQLTTGSYDVTRVYGFDVGTQTLFYQAASTDPMTRYVYALNVKKNKLQRLTAETGTHRATFSATYKYFVDCYQSVTTANRYTLYTSQGKRVRVLLSNEEREQMFESEHFSRKRFFRFATERGDSLNAWILLPDALESQIAEGKGVDLSELKSDRRYPLLQVQYSGPASQQVLDVWKPDWEYFLAKQGIVVVCADPRGTAARGREWKERTYMNLGQLEAEDQVSTARYMSGFGFVDSGRIGIYGWSYGGYMSIRAMMEPDAVYRCGIAVAPVTDWRLYDSAYTERFMRHPEYNDGGYDNASLLSRAGSLNGRLLLCHGVADDNVHCQQAWKLVDALVEAGVQFDMQIYPDDNHFLRKRSNYRHLFCRKWNFLKQWLL